MTQMPLVVKYVYLNGQLDRYSMYSITYRILDWIPSDICASPIDLWLAAVGGGVRT